MTPPGPKGHLSHVQRLRRRQRREHNLQASLRFLHNPATRRVGIDVPHPNPVFHPGESQNEKKDLPERVNHTPLVRCMMSTDQFSL
jgi:hypothetical protein